MTTMASAAIVSQIFFMSGPRRSEGLEVFQQRALFAGVELCSVSFAFVAHIAVSGFRGVEKEELAAVLLGHVGDETNVVTVEHVVAPKETFWGAQRKRSAVLEGWYRAVVQIRTAKPNAIERHGGIATGLAEMLEALRVGRVEAQSFS